MRSLLNWLFGTMQVKDKSYEDVSRSHIESTHLRNGYGGYRYKSDGNILGDSEREEMQAALQANHSQGVALLMSPDDTSFSGTTDVENEDTDVINAVRSIPVHYSFDFKAMSKAVLEFLITDPVMKQLEAEVWAVVLDWLRHEATPSLSGLNSVLANFKASTQQQ